MSEFQKLLGNVKTALEHAAGERPHPVPETAAVVPMTHVARRAELGSKFVRELQAVGGQVIEVGSASEAIEKIAELARRMGARSAVSAKALTADLAELTPSCNDRASRSSALDPLPRTNWPRRARASRAPIWESSRPTTRSRPAARSPRSRARPGRDRFLCCLPSA